MAAENQYFAHLNVALKVKTTEWEDSYYNHFISLWFYAEISQHPWWVIKVFIHTPSTKFCGARATAAQGTTLQQSSWKPPHRSASWTWSQPKPLSPKTRLPWRCGTWVGILPQHLPQLWLRPWSSGGSLQTWPHLSTAEGLWCCPKDAAANWALYSTEVLQKPAISL